jgi:hypothetical protein
MNMKETNDKTEFMKELRFKTDGMMTSSQPTSGYPHQLAMCNNQVTLFFKRKPIFLKTSLVKSKSVTTWMFPISFQLTFAQYLFSEGRWQTLDLLLL